MLYTNLNNAINFIKSAVFLMSWRSYSSNKKRVYNFTLIRSLLIYDIPKQSIIAFTKIFLITINLYQAFMHPVEYMFVLNARWGTVYFITRNYHNLFKFETIPGDKSLL